MFCSVSYDVQIPKLSLSLSPNPPSLSALLKITKVYCNM